MLQRGHSADGCPLNSYLYVHWILDNYYYYYYIASTLCKYDLRKGELFVLSWGSGATSETGKSLFRAANVWWRCA